MHQADEFVGRVDVRRTREPFAAMRGRRSGSASSNRYPSGGGAPTRDAHCGTTVRSTRRQIFPLSDPRCRTRGRVPLPPSTGKEQGTRVRTCLRDDHGRSTVDPNIWYLHRCKISTNCGWTGFGSLSAEAGSSPRSSRKGRKSKDPALQGRVLAARTVSCAGCTAYSTTVRADAPTSHGQEVKKDDWTQHASDRVESRHGREQGAEQPQEQQVREGGCSQRTVADTEAQVGRAWGAARLPPTPPTIPPGRPPCRAASTVILLGEPR